MVNEAKLTATEQGLTPAEEGWFVVNAKDSSWYQQKEFGSSCSFEGKKEFSEFGINICVLAPGQPNGMYHSESVQEDFLVLSGECTLLIEGEERPLKQWDFVHSPARTEHIFVGAGTQPCAILMVGVRGKEATIFYPVSDLARKYGASVETGTPDWREAYAGCDDGRHIQYEDGWLD